LAPHIEGFSGCERQLENLLDDVAEKLGIDWLALLKDARSMIGMIADKVNYSKELEIGCWQLANLDIIEDKKMREEIEWAR
jgi:hypothetical protein